MSLGKVIHYSETLPLGLHGWLFRDDMARFLMICCARNIAIMPR
jgi:hypothetical protein